VGVERAARRTAAAAVVANFTRHTDAYLDTPVDEAKVPDWSAWAWRLQAEPVTSDQDERRSGTRRSRPGPANLAASRTEPGVPGGTDPHSNPYPAGNWMRD